MSKVGEFALIFSVVCGKVDYEEITGVASVARLWWLGIEVVWQLLSRLFFFFFWVNRTVLIMQVQNQPEILGPDINLAQGKHGSDCLLSNHGNVLSMEAKVCGKWDHSTPLNCSNIS